MKAVFYPKMTNRNYVLDRLFSVHFYVPDFLYCFFLLCLLALDAAFEAKCCTCILCRLGGHFF